MWPERTDLRFGGPQRGRLIRGLVVRGRRMNKRTNTLPKGTDLRARTVLRPLRLDFDLERTNLRPYRIEAIEG